MLAARALGLTSGRVAARVAIDNDALARLSWDMGRGDRRDPAAGCFRYVRAISSIAASARDLMVPTGVGTFVNINILP